MEAGGGKWKPRDKQLLEAKPRAVKYICSVALFSHVKMHVRHQSEVCPLYIFVDNSKAKGDSVNKSCHGDYTHTPRATSVNLP